MGDLRLGRNPCRLRTEIRATLFLFPTIPELYRTNSYMTLEELPRHVTFQRGDTIVTSGYSSAFPEGLAVGTVEDYDREEYDDNFYSVRVKLTTDYFRLGDVCIIDIPSAKEQSELEKNADQR